MLEDILRNHVARFIPDPERRDVVMARLGWTGEPAITLQQAGDRLGVTRERARQIASRVYPGKGRRPPRGLTHAVRDALDVVRREAPCTVGSCMAALDEAGCTGGALHPRAVLAAADFLGIGHDLEILGKGSSGIVLSAAHAGELEDVLSLARMHARHCGAVLLDRVPVRDRDGHGSITREMLGIAASLDDRFIDFGGGWHILSDPRERNRVAEVLCKCSSVVGDVPLDDLQHSLSILARRSNYPSRNSQIRVYVPPRDILVGLLDRLPNVERTGDVDGVPRYRARPVPGYLMHRVTPSEADILDAFGRCALRIARYDDVVDEMVGVGRSIAGVTNCLYFSPLFLPLGHGLYTLVGTRPSPDEVEGVRERARHGLRRASDVVFHERLGGGGVRIRIRIPEDRDRLIFRLPPSVAGMLKQVTMPLYLAGGGWIGCLAMNNNHSVYGLTPALRDSFRPGDGELDVVIEPCGGELRAIVEAFPDRQAEAV